MCSQFAKSPTLSHARRRVFRIVAVLIGLSAFPMFELLCAVAGWGELSIGDDPFVGFAGVRPLFERTPDGSHFHTSPARRGFFEEDSFLADKPAEEFRIFVFGGSTVQGNPFSIETSFTRFLQLGLQEAAPERSWEVVNCGGISYASYRLLPLMQECLNYAPDAYIVCSGHNEFLEDVTYRDIRDQNSAVPAIYSTLSRFRSVRLAKHLSNQLRGAADDLSLRPTVSAEVDALLDHQGGLEAYCRDDTHAALVAAHYRSNLTRMVQLTEQHELPLLLIRPPSNLSDCPPFKSEFAAATSAEQIAQIRQLLDQADQVLRQDPNAAAEILRRATEIDGRFSFSWYQLGHALLAASRFDEARQAFLRARDEDICPLRITTPLEAGLQDVVSRLQPDFLDAAQLLEASCENGVLGDNVLADHIHPSFRGHQQMALAIIEWMQRAEFVEITVPDWKGQSEQRFADHLQSLDNLYFLRGRRRLQDLQGWAAGRAEGAPIVRKPRADDTHTRQ